MPAHAPKSVWRFSDKVMHNAKELGSGDYTTTVNRFAARVMPV